MKMNKLIQKYIEGVMPLPIYVTEGHSTFVKNVLLFSKEILYNERNITTLSTGI